WCGVPVRTHVARADGLRRRRQGLPPRADRRRGNARPGNLRQRRDGHRRLRELLPRTQRTRRPATFRGLTRPDLHAQQAWQRRANPSWQCWPPPFLVGLLAGEDRTPHEAATQPLQRLRRERRDAARCERERRPLVVEAERQRRQDLAAEPARADAVAGVAEPEVDASCAW